EMTRRSTFWRFFLYCILSAAIGNTVISAAKDISLSVGAAAALATTLVGVLSICNGLGRILSGALFDAF
ncbi:MAG TPA: MFS transporter, partial [Syntrophomonas sp.]|nr:MFS transporter [Syntrophomonas sp.]